jgi:hypothetical protein
LFLGLVAIAPLTAQVESETVDLRLTAIDYSDFPVVRLRLLATGKGGAPISDLSRLTVRENGLPIESATTTATPIGADIVMVLDANPDYLLIDDATGLSRRDKVAAAIGGYAERFMNPAGLDRVSVVVPDDTGDNPAFLATDLANPAGLAAAAAAYEPIPPRVTPLNDMLAAAIDHLAARDDQSRAGAILLYTDGARLDRQLDYPVLTGAARAAGVPIFVAILGSEASPEEVTNITGLTLPTNGQFVHTPQPEDAAPLFQILQDLGRQVEIAYRSGARQSGTQEVTVNLGNQRVGSAYDLVLEAPQVAIELAQPIIRRAGSAPDTPLALLQPAALPLTALINWPDGQPRELAEVTFLVNNAVQPLATTPVADDAGKVPLIWDISDLDEGTYRLQVAVVDELGFRAESAPVEAAIEVSRPTPPTATPAPTRGPLVSLPDLPPGDKHLAFLAPFLLALALGAAGAFWFSRRHRAAHRAKARLPQSTAPPPIPRPSDRHVPILEWLDSGGAVGERIELLSHDVTLGRAAEAVDIVVDDPSVSPLHARIRRSSNDEYWLYDEGSSRGTFLNYERLGLAPRQMQHGDTIQIGRVTLRFVMELPLAADDPADDSPSEAMP